MTGATVPRSDPGDEQERDEQQGEYGE